VTPTVAGVLPGYAVAQRGRYTPAEQQRRERLRLEASGRLARGDKINEIAQDLQVSVMASVFPHAGQVVRSVSVGGVAVLLCYLDGLALEEGAVRDVGQRAVPGTARR
jgi:hypothetical protein